MMNSVFRKTTEKNISVVKMGMYNGIYLAEIMAAVSEVKGDYNKNNEVEET